MAKFETSYSGSVVSMESRKRKLTCLGVPLPYMIRPRRKLPYDIFSIYNDYAEESDDEVKIAVVTEKVNCYGGNCFGLGNKSNASLSEMSDSVNDVEKDEEDSVNHGEKDEEEYVIVNDVEVDSTMKTERPGAIQMMSLSKDDVPVSPKESDDGDSENDGSESEGSNSDCDEWVVV